MKQPSKTHPTLEKCVASFVLDRRAKGLATKTIRFYTDYLNQFHSHFNALGINQVEAITPDSLRAFMLTYAESHNAGGCHAIFRSIRAFLRWYEEEFEPTNFKNPLRKVKAPKVPIEPLTPVSMEDVSALLATCKRGHKIDRRDQAIILTLIDTGVRANELLSMRVEDVDLETGGILVRQGKGRKPRTVFIGQRTRKALRAYLRNRRDGLFFVTIYGEALDISGLRAIMRRRATMAGIETPSLHAFRRAFAINCLRAGMDIFSLQRLMGHSDLSVLRRYLNQSSHDLQTAHRAASPADQLKVPRTPRGALAGALFTAAGVPVEEQE